MKKSIAILILMSIFSFMISGCSSSVKSSDNITLFLANVHDEDYPTSAACDEFAKLVSEKTNGRINIETYHNGDLGDESSNVKQIQAGGIDFARVSISMLSSFDESLNVLQLPFIYRDNNHMWAVLNGEVGQDMLKSDKLSQNGIEGLAWYTGGSRNFYTTKKPITSPNDLDGMNIRVQQSDLMIGFISTLGGKPVPLAFADVKSALDNGTLDGAENSIPSYVSTGHYETAKYLTVDEHIRAPEMIIASTKSMKKLSDEDQKIIRECAVESTKKQIELWDKYEQESLAKAQQEGCTITYLTDEQHNEFKDAVADFNKKQGEQYLDILNKIENAK